MTIEQVNLEYIYQLRKSIRIDALEMATCAGKAGAHLGGSFSAIDIIATLYGAFLKYDVNNPAWEDRDRFITSKRHCYLASYAALYEIGMITKEQMLSFHENGGFLAGYPWKKEYGLDFSGGSLGMGLSVAVGMALNAKRFKKNYKTYVLLGDGECDEGAVWEGIMSAVKYSLDNLIIIVDKNNLQFDGSTDEVMPIGCLKERFSSFGCNVLEANGHSIKELVKVFSVENANKPLVVIANTVKGYGLPSIENRVESHHAVLKPEDYATMLKEIQEGRYDRD